MSPAAGTRLPARPRRGCGDDVLVTERIIVALDVPSASRAFSLVDRIGAECVFYKVGLELYAAGGPRVVSALREKGKEVFLDLKFHDIPNTVGRAVARAAARGASLLTVHALGGPAMLRAAAEAAPAETTALGVTVLTSHDAASLGSILGRAVHDVGAEASRLAAMVRAAGLGGVVCSAAEAAVLRARLGPGAAVVTPGIRPPGADAGDQRRVRTAAEAFAAGASHVVVGRPVTRADDPAEAFAAMAASVAGAGPASGRDGRPASAGNAAP